jgi:hypothetical protein
MRFATHRGVERRRGAEAPRQVGIGCALVEIDLSIGFASSGYAARNTSVDKKSRRG